MNLFDVYPINEITIVKAKGSYVWDDKGEQYLDLYGGHAVISIGHTHPQQNCLLFQFNKNSFTTRTGRKARQGFGQRRLSVISL